MKKVDTIILFLVAIMMFSACDVFKKSKKNNVKRPLTEKPVKSDQDDADQDDMEDVLATAEEIKMIDEINLLRQNPKGYVRYVKEYLKYFEKENFPSLGAEKRAANDLMAQLKNTSPLPELNYHEALYKVAESHGKYLKKRGNIFSESPHKGRNGSTTEERARSTRLKLVGENFGSGHTSPRYQLISLLVDAGIPDYQHRLNILDPRWNVVACYDIGTIGIDEGCWLQMFGYEEQETSTTDVDEEDQMSLSDVQKMINRATYMKAEEREMLNEINLLRSNPRAYVKHIEAYKKKVESGEIFPFVTVEEELSIADDLIADLKKMRSLNLLKPDLKLYNVAMAHGAYLRRKGNIDLNGNPHAGRNGKGAHERIVEGANMSRGGENYQGTILPVRETVIGLLIDSGIPGFGHRKALLNPAWDHGICHNFGPMKTSGGITIPDNWLQNFAKR